MSHAARALALMAVVAGGCSRTEMMVTISGAGLAVPDQVDTVSVVVRDKSAGQTVYAPPAITLCGAGQSSGCQKLPLTLRLVPGASMPHDVVEIEVTALQQGATRIDDAATFTFVSGQSQKLEFVLSAGCLGTRCADSGRSCDSSGMCVGIGPPPSAGDLGVGGGGDDLAGAPSGDLAFPTACVTPTKIAAGTQPISVALGDFDGDGDRDIAALDYMGNKVYILFNDGRGNFTVGPNTGVDSGPFRVVAGDFDGDGKLDLAVTSIGAGKVDVLRGNGDGTFASTSYAVGNSPHGLALADFDKNGSLDIAVANSNDNTVAVLHNDGSGGFAAVAPSTTTVNYGPIGVAAADLDGDGVVDVAVGAASDTAVEVYRGKGDGTFTTSMAQLSVGTSTEDVVFADIDGDGKLDVASASGSTVGKIYSYRNLGGFNFQPFPTVSVGAMPDSMAIGDVNGDGVADLISANSGSGDVSLVRGAGGGAFGVAQSCGAASSPHDVAIADLDGNGRGDLIVAGYASGAVAILLQ